MHDRDLPTYHMRALRMIWKRTRTIPLRLVVVLTGLLRLLRHGVAVFAGFAVLTSTVEFEQLAEWGIRRHGAFKRSNLETMHD